MTSKLKLVLIATIAAVSLASPAFAQSAQNSRADTHQGQTLSSGQTAADAWNMYDGNQGDQQGSAYPGDN
jgi:hypothetical protein